MPIKFPPPTYSNIPGSWAHSTVSKRLPEIAAQVIEENQYPDEINEALTRLQEEINHHPIRPLLDQGAPDQGAWEEYVQPYIGQSWLEVPWFFVEHYFYRRIMEAVRYFQLGQDPFGYQKAQGLEKSREEIRYLSNYFQKRIGDEEHIEGAIREGLYYSLWGNQADLSLWPAGSDTSPKHASLKSLDDHLLANDMRQIINIVSRGTQALARVDLLLDNAGFELVSDLALVDVLLGFGLVERVFLHAKTHPTFVSDVIPLDVVGAIDFLRDQSDPATLSFGKRLEMYVLSGRLITTSHLFWNSPLPMWKLPDDLEEEWKGSSLVISKGDANYRRLLGNLEWEYTLPFEQVVDYLPVPLGAIRTLKSELALGMDATQIQRAAQQDPDWMVDGRWGVIHFARGRIGWQSDTCG
ncbi:MAG TPA: protein-glutamate O-methyltransferase family protein [Chloroflexi bacterium]|nr:MAG: protein-glutamate O-methyltransferase family protein [Chloroflexota bacterium]HDD55238.1 protein-glutamate O-methyltransferase family protein [Chloroflexota bacterium]